MEKKWTLLSWGYMGFRVRGCRMHDWGFKQTSVRRGPERSIGATQVQNNKNHTPLRNRPHDC